MAIVQRYLTQCPCVARKSVIKVDDPSETDGSLRFLVMLRVVVRSRLEFLPDLLVVPGPLGVKVTPMINPASWLTKQRRTA